MGQVWAGVEVPVGKEPGGRQWPLATQAGRGRPSRTRVPFFILVPGISVTVQGTWHHTSLPVPVKAKV